MKKYFILTLIVMVSSLQTHAQELKAGQQFPSLVLNNVINYTDSVIELSAFKGKGIILDFWATNCPGCIRGLPTIDSLQHLFEGKIQFIIVTREKKENVEDFFATRKKIRQPSVPFITGDAIIDKLFPHEIFPFHVWIDPKGIVRYTTNALNTTASNIRAFLNDDILYVADDSKPRRDGFMVYDSSTQIEFYSTLAHSNINNWVDGGSNGARINNGYNVRLCSYRSSVAELCRRAWEENGRYSFKLPEKVIFETTDTTGWVRPKGLELREAWDDKYAYDYDLVLPASRKKDMYKCMQQDISRYFNIEVTVEKRDQDCLVLVRTGEEDRLHTKGGKAVDGLNITTAKKIISDPFRVLQNKPFSFLSTRLSSLCENFLFKPMVDETGYTGNIDISFTGELIDNLSVENIRKDLQRYGLNIISAKRKIDTLVIRKKE